MFIIIATIIVIIKKKKKQETESAESRSEISEPLYATIEEVNRSCDTDDIEVVPNESYAMIASQEESNLMSYGSMKNDNTELVADGEMSLSITAV